MADDKNKIENEHDEQEKKVQYILNENKELVEIPKESAIPVEFPIKYKINNAFEVFVRVKGTENYWISNYGRCVNNYRSVINSKKDKKNYKFYEHKMGECHITIYEIERVVRKLRGGKEKKERKIKFIY